MLEYLIAMFVVQRLKQRTPVAKYDSVGQLDEKQSPTERFIIDWLFGVHVVFDSEGSYTTAPNQLDI